MMLFYISVFVFRLIIIINLIYQKCKKSLRLMQGYFKDVNV
ncbi:hypothetical protein ANS017_18720 [Paraclostridium bifermentans]|nr:hypothetical protein ANS014_13920 [Paraclostridium bifermentans]GKZ07554.1 hypothetical protein ANS015_24370 [Paraclostridium bifermentans]GKZ10488.1 hypothetical protein ANS017_18720 [Paraclostridium bifermentans]